MALLIIICFIFCSFLKNKALRFVTSVILSAFSVLQLTSLFIVRTYIGYSFIIHFNKRDIDGMMDLFTFQIFLIVFLITVLTYVFYKSRMLLAAFNSKIKKPKLLRAATSLIIILALFTMSLPKGVINSSYTLIKSLQVDNKGFTKNLEALNMSDYVKPENLKVSSSKKNIIIIALESFEKGYLSDKFEDLTPFLRSLKTNQDWTYLDLNQNEGSKWTSGSLYTSITGFPAYFGTYHNKIFQNSYHSNITGITHILDKENYSKTYLSANAKVSGTNDMLYALKIDQIIDKTELKEKIQDKDLFDKAKDIVDKNTSNNKAFALFIATLSTHFPNGIYDNRFEDIIAPQNSNLEYMVAATDNMLKSFLTHLQTTGALENTTVYIFPDHLKMGSDTIFDDTGERGLFIFTNAPKNNIETYKTQVLYQIDLPKIIMDGAQIKHNATFLTDYVTGNKNEFIKDNITALTALNISGFSRAIVQPFLIPKKSEKFSSYKKDTLRFIAHAGGIIDKHTYTNSLEALNSSYNKGFRLFELDIIKTSDGKYVAAHYWDEWKEKTKYKGDVPTTKDEFLKYKIHEKYTPLDMDAINKWFTKHKDAILITDKVNEPNAFSELFIDKNRLMMELFTLEAVKEGIAANIKSAMPSQRVIFNLKGNKIKKLKALNITDIAMSRLKLAENLELFKALKENNIKVFAYNINEMIDRDENYVVKYEMDYFYGIYADHWEFKD
ncbi:sulfatase-like hydrolase/transferase [Lacinutrix sp. Bg11-31]|uniref:sulfatase-like hydrolase/transferase n=1 Tax=Lacinutrix sp. Bg11-31 TaxID=2057808 RepID=UPI0012FE3165|nr:sulfatase-like hydrolase/transferase [Lacinutrix sp. Bg11-31]